MTVESFSVGIFWKISELKFELPPTRGDIGKENVGADRIPTLGSEIETLMWTVIGKFTPGLASGSSCAIRVF